MSKFWNFTKNVQNESVELHISGEVMGDNRAWIYEWYGIPSASPNAFRKELGKNKGKDIVVWIDSPGGDVFAGAGIYNALKEHDGKVTVKITKAMSIASVFAMAGDDVFISPGGIFMMHNPIGKVEWGEAKDMRHAADVLDEVKETIINAYQLKTGKSREVISRMMDEETFMSANTAIKEGFADKILYTEDETIGNTIENNFIFSRLAIQNSMADSMKKFFEIAKDNLPQNTVEPQAKEATQEPEVNNNQKEEKEIMHNTVEELRNAYPQLVQEIENTAVANERERIKNIEKISKNIDPALVNKAKFEEPKDAKELAFEALQTDGQKGETYLQNLKEDAVASNVATIAINPTISNNLEPKTFQDKLKNVAQNFDLERRGMKKGENV